VSIPVPHFQDAGKLKPFKIFLDGFDSSGRVKAMHFRQDSLSSAEHTFVRALQLGAQAKPVWKI